VRSASRIITARCSPSLGITLRTPRFDARQHRAGVGEIVKDYGERPLQLGMHVDHHDAATGEEAAAFGPTTARLAAKDLRDEQSDDIGLQSPLPLHSVRHR
jgi:hypothetical protein